MRGKKVIFISKMLRKILCNQRVFWGARVGWEWGWLSQVLYLQPIICTWFSLFWWHRQHPWGLFLIQVLPLYFSSSSPQSYGSVRFFFKPCLKAKVVKFVAPGKHVMLVASSLQSCFSNKNMRLWLNFKARSSFRQEFLDSFTKWRT